MASVFEPSSIKALLANTLASKATGTTFLKKWDDDVCGSLPALYLFTQNFYGTGHWGDQNLPHFMSRWRRSLNGGPKHIRVTLDRRGCLLSSHSPHPCRKSSSLSLMSPNTWSSFTHTLKPWWSLATSHYRTMSHSWGLISSPPCCILYPGTAKSCWCWKLIASTLWLLYIPYTTLSTALTVKKHWRPLTPCPTLPIIKKFLLNGGPPMLDYRWSAIPVKQIEVWQRDPPRQM